MAADERDSKIMADTVHDLLDYIDELEAEMERLKAQRDKAVENLERFCGKEVLTVLDVNSETANESTNNYKNKE